MSQKERIKIKRERLGFFFLIQIPSKQTTCCSKLEENDMSFTYLCIHQKNRATGCLWCVYPNDMKFFFELPDDWSFVLLMNWSFHLIPNGMSFWLFECPVVRFFDLVIFLFFADVDDCHVTLTITSSRR